MTHITRKIRRNCGFFYFRTDQNEVLKLVKEIKIRKHFGVLDFSIAEAVLFWINGANPV
jgi:hypothetical protein